MNFFISERFNMFNKCFCKNNNIYAEKFDIESALFFLQKEDREYYNMLSKALENHFFKIGFDFFLKNNKTNSANMKETLSVIKQISFNEFESIGRFLDEQTNMTETVVSDWKAFVNLQSSGYFSELSFFRNRPNIKVIFIYNESTGEVVIVCREGYELYGKKIFNNVKQHKHKLIFFTKNKMSALKLFEKISEKDILDEKNYEKDGFFSLVNYMKKHRKFTAEMEEAFFTKLKELFGIHVEKDKRKNIIEALFISHDKNISKDIEMDLLKLI